MKIKNYTFKQYSKLPLAKQQEYALMLRLSTNIERKNYISTEDVEEWTFTLVKELMQNIEDIDAFTNVLLANRKEFQDIEKESAYKVIISIGYVYQRIIELINLEATTLVGYTSNEVMEASQGVGFEEFGCYTQLLELANNDITKIEAVEQMPYCDCYTFLRYKAKESLFQKRLNDIYKRKR
ncbi:MAG: hypothetical protein MJ197_08645 [Bacteroidales bacterium]|nr:hypothetical protein [Bacteroidales bacterium]